MQYSIFFFAILAFLSGNTGTNKQADSKLLADSATCQNGLMQKAWYSYGVDSTLQPLQDQRKENGKITNTEYQQLNSLGKTVSTTDLQDLIDKKLLEKIGTTGRGTRYILSNVKGR